MAESLDAFAALDQVRRELRQLNSTVEAVEARVEQARVVQMAALAVMLARDTDVPAEVTLNSARLTHDQIGALLGKSRDAVRMNISRYRRRVQKPAQ